MFRNVRVVPTGKAGMIFLCAAALLAAAFLFAPPAYALYEISDGSVTGLYHMNGASTDSSGNGYNGSDTGVAYVSGKVGSQAWDKNGTGALYTTLDTAALNATGNFTAGFWLNIQEPSPASTYIMYKRRSGTDGWDGIGYSATVAANSLEVTKAHASGNSGHSYSWSPATSTWHWVVVRRSSNTIDAYINNSLLTSWSESNTASITGSWFLGCLPQQSQTCTSGSEAKRLYLDELFFLNAAISTTTRDGLWNGGNGTEICVTAGCASTSTPYIVSSTQLRSDGLTVIAEASSTAETSVVFKALLNSSSSNQLKLQIQLSTSTLFTNVRTATSSAVSPNNYATTTITDLSDAVYYWRMKALDIGTNASSSWAQFGVENVADFTVHTAPYIEISNGSVAGLYHMEGNSNDSSGNGRNGSDSGVAYVSGKLYSAWDKGGNGGNRYSSFDTAALNTTGDFTAGFWLRFKGDAFASTYIMYKRRSGTDGWDGIGYDATVAANSLEVTKAHASGNSAHSFSWSPAMDTWYWVVIRRSGNTIDAYVDNALLTSWSESNTASITSNWFLGCLIQQSQTCSEGSYSKRFHVDEVFFMNNAISTSTRNALWNSGNGAEICTTEGCSDANILSGAITTNATWFSALGPYIVTSTVTVNSGVKVTVEPGTVIKFKPNTSLIVNGELDVKGGTTSSTLVYFTSYKDDVVGGDTNGDGGATAPTSSDWGHIQFNSGASSTLLGGVVRYGGGNASTTTNIYMNGGTLRVSSTDISSSSYYGFKINSGTTTITNSMIRNNKTAMDIDSGNVTITSSSIFNNSTYGVLRTSGPTSTMSSNFWGGWYPLDVLPTSTTFNAGPYNQTTNPYGVGDPVSGYVNFNPYIVAYLSHPANPFWSPPGVNSSTLKMRVGSSTQYYDELVLGINKWNASSSAYVTIIDASTTAPWDIYVADINNSSSQHQYKGIYIPNTTGTPRIVFNDYYINDNPDQAQCVATHELGHAMGLAHSTGPEDNIMAGGSIGGDPCYDDFIWDPLLNLGTQDIHDFNLLWSPSYFFDPHQVKRIIQ